MVIDNFRGKYDFLSNFYKRPVVYNGLTFKDNEAAFQAQKVADNKDQMLAFTKIAGSDAKHLGRLVQCRKDWEQVKVQIMTDIVRAKFTQNPDLAENLKGTYPAELIEGNNWNDKFWGKCHGVGQNHLGEILMKVRQELMN